jgi:hypothetical protein
MRASWTGGGISTAIVRNSHIPDVVTAFESTMPWFQLRLYQDCQPVTTLITNEWRECPIIPFCYWTSLIKESNRPIARQVNCNLHLRLALSISRAASGVTCNSSVLRARDKNKPIITRITPAMSHKIRVLLGICIKLADMRAELM